MIVWGDFNDDFLRFSPSLIIEVASKRTQILDRNVKFKIYENSGVAFYIIVDTERKAVDVFKLAEKNINRWTLHFFRLLKSAKSS